MAADNAPGDDRMPHRSPSMPPSSTRCSLQGKSMPRPPQHSTHVHLWSAPSLQPAQPMNGPESAVPCPIITRPHNAQPLPSLGLIPLYPHPRHHHPLTHLTSLSSGSPATLAMMRRATPTSTSNSFMLEQGCRRKNQTRRQKSNEELGPANPLRCKPSMC